MKRVPYPLYLGLLGALAAGSAAAGDTDDLHRCAEMESDAQRLECYDTVLRSDAAEPHEQQSATVESSGSAVAKAPAQNPPAPVEPAPASEARFGVDTPAEPAKPAEEMKALGARIAAIEVRRNGERIFTLDNGQVWAEKSPSPSLHLEVGDRVTVKSGLFGSHRLFGSGKRSSGVDPVR
jgi:hypothetical protein